MTIKFFVPYCPHKNFHKIQKWELILGKVFLIAMRFYGTCIEYLRYIPEIYLGRPGCSWNDSENSKYLTYEILNIIKFYVINKRTDKVTCSFKSGFYIIIKKYYLRSNTDTLMQNFSFVSYDHAC